jgi:glyoxylase-like metal-dependent hydrolase (beta-lactamase superfamily II)
MTEHIIHPIPLMVLCRSMHEQVYRVGAYAGHTAVDGVYSWYIEGPKKKIVVDAGMTAQMLRDANVPGLSTDVRHVQTLEEGLGKYGLRPEDIDLLIQTHCHVDHIPLAPLFSKAGVVVQQSELDYHRNPPPPPVDPRPCPEQFLNGLNWEVVDGDCEIEEGVRVLLTPGHTAGGQSVAVDTAEGVAIIDGLCTTDANWEVPASLADRMEVLCPAIHNDALQSYESLMRIKQMADIRVPIHEPRFIWVERIPA